METLVFTTTTEPRTIIFTDEDNNVRFGITANQNEDCFGKVAKALMEDLDADEIKFGEIDADRQMFNGTINFTSIEDGEEFEREYYFTLIHIY